MRIVVAVLTVGIVAAGYSVPAGAVGCFTGGVAGAVAGHMAHHGVLGAIGGCIAGHEYHKHQKARAQQQSAGENEYAPQNGYSNQGRDGNDQGSAAQRNTY